MSSYDWKFFVRS